MKAFRRALAASVAAVALIAAGCGDDNGDGGESLSAEDYAAEIQGILDPVGPELQQIGGELSQLKDSQTEQIAAGLEESEGVLNDAIAEIEGVEPPEDAAEAQDQLVAAMEGFVSETEKFREAVLDGNARQQATAFQQAGLDFQTELQEAVSSYQEAGIQVGPSAGGE